MLTLLYFRLIISIFGIWLLIGIVFKKGSNIYVNKVILSKRKFVLKNEKKMDLIFRITSSIIAIIVVIYVFAPCILDVTYCIQGKYITSTVTTIGWDFTKPDSIVLRDIEVMDIKSNKKFTIHYYSKKVDKGTTFTIEYLPNTKFARLIKT